MQLFFTTKKFVHFLQFFITLLYLSADTNVYSVFIICLLCFNKQNNIIKPVCVTGQNYVQVNFF